MNKSHPSFNITECKIQAAILMKSLNSPNKQDAQKSLKRFQRLPEFKATNLADLKQHLKYKHALRVVALEKGFQSWAELKCQLPFIRGGFLNHWFANYDDAKSYHKLHKGFLLPYQKQFFICDADYIQQLGFNIPDSDWKLIKYDWVKPENREAFKRLYQKWIVICEATHEKF